MKRKNLTVVSANKLDFYHPPECINSKTKSVGLKGWKPELKLESESKFKQKENEKLRSW